MIIVEPSVQLLSITPDAEHLIERCGRICYKSEEKITEGTAAGFIVRIIQMGHEAVLEHANATMLFICDRGVTHEIVRHRLASYCQESTRYCNYSKAKFGNEIAVVKPPFPPLPGDPVSTALAYTAWKAACEEAERRYMEMIDKGCAPQIARSVLPTCLKTEIAMTANFREWRHFCKLRCSERAHPQMRPLALSVMKQLWQNAPAVFNDLMREFLPAEVRQ